jgi:polyisoprenoid-binding protein YceI
LVQPRVANLTDCDPFAAFVRSLRQSSAGRGAKAEAQSMKVETWQVDTAHSSVAFSVRHLTIANITGHFTKWEGTLRIDTEELARSSVEVLIDAASVDTRDPARDGHVRTSEFLDVERYPEIRFKSSWILPVGDGTFRLGGNLTFRGVTRDIVLDAVINGRITDPWGNERIGFSAKATVDRQDYGVTWRQVLDGGELVLADAIDLVLEIEATNVTAPPEIRHVASEVADSANIGKGS